MIRCLRCGTPAPVEQFPPGYDPGGDPDVPLVTLVPPNWYPSEVPGEDGICCALCSTDDEINSWLRSPAWRYFSGLPSLPEDDLPA